MLSVAAERLPSNEKIIVHSDRGAHYRWPGWIGLMDKFGFTRSMSQKGSTPDNAQAESFFGHLKTEFFYNRSWIGKSIDDFIQALNEYIGWYNTKRRKKVLGGKSPQKYRQSKIAWWLKSRKTSARPRWKKTPAVHVWTAGADWCKLEERTPSWLSWPSLLFLTILTFACWCWSLR